MCMRNMSDVKECNLRTGIFCMFILPTLPLTNSYSQKSHDSSDSVDYTALYNLLDKTLIVLRVLLIKIVCSVYFFSIIVLIVS